MSEKITESARQIPVVAEVDVLVIGGGPAGVAAAAGAARAGARTLVLERHGFLGGMWTAGMVLTLAGFNSWLRPYKRCVAGIGGEWVERAEEQDGARFDNGFVINTEPEVMKRVADELLRDAGVETLFHTWGATPIMEGDRVAGAFIENKDGRGAILAGVTIDCTGDGDFIERSGAKWTKSDSLQPMTMSFRVSGAQPNADVRHDVPTLLPIGPESGVLRDPVLTDYSSSRLDVELDSAAMAQAAERGELPRYGGPWFGGLDKDLVWVNSTRIVGDASVAAELSRAEIEGRQDTRRVVDYFTSSVPAFANAKLVQTSTQIGVRETRRLIGELVMTGDDVREARRFTDSIAVGCWPIDVHPTEKQVGTHSMFVPEPFDISYRVMVPTEIDGLLAAGRCVSVDRDALGSMRVGATCAAIGHGAGVAAAIAVASGVQPRAVDVSRVQEVLREQGAIVDVDDVE
ncbi:FAD-dependent oxidoreductase [Microbacterium sp. A588]